MALGFRILGSVEVAQHGTPVRLGGPKQQALLARLLLDVGRVVSIPRLVEDLWEEDAPASATKMIHIHVSQLRKAIGPDFLLTVQPGYRLDAPADAVDAERFAALAERGRGELPADARAAAATLNEALALWRGPALDGLDESFAVTEAARLDELRLATTEDRGAAELELGAHARLVPELQTLVARHPLRERFREQLMLALYRCGRQADALESYQQHRRYLDDELGLRPSPALVDLERRILAHDGGLDPPAPGGTVGAGVSVAAPSPAGLGSLVGRAAELALLRDRWRKASGGAGQVVLISGEPGIGKSRLCEELIATIEGDYASFTLRCSPERASSPYDPLARELGRCLGVSERTDGHADIATAATVFGLDDGEAALVLGSILAADNAEAGDASQHETLAALTAWFPAVAESLPALVVFEDLHWADAATIEFLGMLVDEATASRLLVVATFRHEFTHAWMGRANVAMLALDRLTPGETEELVHHVAGNALDDGRRAEVAARSDGVPLFVEELARAALSAGDHALPASLDGVLAARLGRLGATEREMAGIAAVLGRDFSFAEIGALSGWPPEELERALDALVDTQILHQRGQAPRAYYLFRHALMRDAAYRALEAPRRRILHARAGQLPLQPAPVRTHHLRAAGSPA